ncbi:methylated-DNA-[protein]-cysteine S-methyltransferase [Austwickia chelonae]|uniref:Methylated-DNA--protein-cysteine methyltransferase n=1 Tax=Austwickia chelonae NBRC 105200 TaxID=1184607 RepID=K6UMB3_9MICO|nr:methylated-DNA--[protein]-cysteine S-methyltransferase [Austwickia chelonae]GAB77961.1 methylated-DNA--protein-cysteine methyltransferase [Austwickia chelonae NBRC 105200]SEV93139.1 methylated-DNA-[protein]-cysteine S-methyltransferase [Austwickia chelonae]
MAATRRHAHVTTVLGELLLVADVENLVGIYFPEHRYPPSVSEIGEETTEETDELIARAARELREYLGGDRRSFDLPVASAGNEFSERVWALLRTIPYGTTTTYGALAEQLGNKALAQRVGQAVGRNPLSIVVPCHRVVGADGSLTGFAGGLDRKRFLLGLEESEAGRAGRLF